MPAPEDLRPQIFLVEQYQLASFRGDLARDDLVDSISLSPGGSMTYKVIVRKRTSTSTELTSTVLDSQDRPIVASCTMSSDIPTTGNAPFPNYQGGDQDAYVFAMDPGLTTQLWATFYGGTGTDACYSLQVDANDEVFVTGGTSSTDLDLAGTPYMLSLIHI